MHSENYIIQLQTKLIILDTALIESCKSICKYMNYSEEEVIRMKQRFINKARESCKAGELE